MKRLAFVLLLTLFLFLDNSPVAVAQDNSTSTKPTGNSTSEFFSGTLQFLCLGVFAYYMMVVFPKTSQQTEHNNFLSKLKKNDEVMTSGGIIGKVHSLNDKDGKVVTDGKLVNEVMLEVSNNLRLRVHPRYLLKLPTEEAKSPAVKNASTAPKSIFSLKSKA